MSQALLICRQVELARTLSSVLHELCLFDAVYMVRTGRGALAKLREMPCDIVLMVEGTLRDVVPESIKVLKEARSETKVLVLARAYDKEWVLATYLAGANSILPIDVDAAELDLAIRTLLHGLTLIGSNSISAFVVSSMFPPPTDAKLDKDDLQILKLISQGFSNKSIAKQIYYSENTVKYRISSLMARFDVNTRVELAVSAVRNRLI